MKRDQHVSDSALFASAEGAGVDEGVGAAHLASCDACRRRLAEYQALITAARAPVPTAPEGMLERAIARAEAEGVRRDVRNRTTNYEGEKTMIPNAFTPGTGPLPGADSVRGSGIFRKFKVRWLPEIAATAIVMAAMGILLHQRLTQERVELSPTPPVLKLQPDHRFDHAPVLWETRQPRFAIAGPVRIEITRIALVKAHAWQYSQKPYTLLIEGQITPLQTGTMAVGPVFAIPVYRPRAMATTPAFPIYGSCTLPETAGPFLIGLEEEYARPAVPEIKVCLRAARASSLKRMTISLSQPSPIETRGTALSSKGEASWRIIIDHFKGLPGAQIFNSADRQQRVSTLARLRIEESTRASKISAGVDPIINIESPWTWSNLDQSARPLSPGWEIVARGIALPEMDAHGDPTPSKPWNHPADLQPVRPPDPGFRNHITLNYLPSWNISSVSALFPPITLRRPARQ